MVGVALVFLVALFPSRTHAQAVAGGDARLPGVGVVDVDALAVAEFEALVATDPTIVETQEAALAAGGWSTLPDGSWVRAARATAALPTVTFDVGWRGVQAGRQERSDTRDTDAEASAADQTVRDLRRDDAASQVDAGLRLQWDLRPAAWSTMEQSAIALVFDATEQRLALLTEVNEAYFARRAALWAALHAATSEGEFDARMAFDASTARLDALTGGWFSESLARGPREGP